MGTTNSVLGGNAFCVGGKWQLRKYCFTNRFVNTRNSFPNWVVTAEITNTFKSRGDTFWHNQDIMYDFRAQFKGLVKFRIK